MNWLKNLKGRVLLEEELKNHTTFRIGGPAQYFVEPKDEGDLAVLLRYARDEKLPVLVIGAGSNLLVHDKGVKGFVVKLSAPSFKRMTWEGDTLTVGSGVLLSCLIRQSRQKGLSSLEFLAGIPGTLGGALIMNAGIEGKGIGDLIKEVMVMDYRGNTKKLSREEIKFSYRNSTLTKYIVLGARLRLVKKEKNQIQDTIKNYLERRKENQEWRLPSAGCVFKNPYMHSAGKLIDLCGFKGKQIGDARVSERHANFIVNVGGARCEDVSKLMSIIRTGVEKKFSITLEPEIKLWK